MPQAAPIQTAFNSGEWHRTLDGRVDLKAYGAACRKLTNFVPLVEGPARKRSGTRWVQNLKDQNATAWLLPFRFSTEQAYVLEFSDFLMRVYKDNGIVELSPGVPYELVAPWPVGELRYLQIAQSADLIYVAHPRYPTQVISRTGDTAWTIAEVAFNWEPFSPENVDNAVTMIASAETGAITITAVGYTFTNEDVGRLIQFREVVETKHRPWLSLTDYSDTIAKYSPVLALNVTCRYEGRVFIVTNMNANTKTGSSPPVHDTGAETDGQITWTYLHSGRGYARIDSWVSGTVVNATVIKRIPASCVSAATFRWAWNAFSENNGYPRAVTFFEDRLWLAGTAEEPDRIHGSYQGQYENFNPTDDAFGAQNYRLNSNQVNMIESLAAFKTMIMLTSGGEWPARGTEDNSVISIENPMSASQHSSHGTREGVQAIVVDNVALFVQRSGRKIRELVFDDLSQSYVAQDLSVYAPHLIAGGIMQLAYQQEPTRTVYCVTEDGRLACVLYDRPNEVLAWYEIVPGGTGVTVESAAVIPHPDGDGDQLWLLVRRNFGGTVTRSIEYMEKFFADDAALADAYFVDSGLTYDGAPATTITGLNHLDGREVDVLADGKSVGPLTVASNQITLPEAASVVHVGFAYTARFESMRVEAGSADGTAQGKLKRVTDVVFRLFRSGEGLFYGVGADESELDPWAQRTPFDLAGDPVPLFDGDTEHLTWPADYDQGGFINVEHARPTPCTLVAVMPRVTTEDRP